MSTNDEPKVNVAHLAMDADGGTPVPSRDAFVAVVRRALRQAKRGGAPVAVLSVDLDRFRALKLQLGHRIANGVLGIVARRLERTLIGLYEDVFVARLDADEVGVMVTGLTGDTEALLCAGRCSAALHEPIRLPNETIYLTAAVGAALGRPDDAFGADQLIHEAAITTLEAKRKGPGGIAVYDRATHERLMDRLGLERMLRRALHEWQVELDYQPIVSLESEHIVGLEALARWRRPGQPPLPASAFIPLAERTGMMATLGRQLFARACGDIARWRETLGHERVPTVNVNFSALQLADPTCATTVSSCLEEHHLEPSAVKLEVTEAAWVGPNDTTRQTVDELHKLGLSLSIDDFGTGYSSLAYLHELPVTELKLDRSFTTELTKTRPTVEAILNLADQLDIRVVAEGIETRRQKDGLTALGCRWGQGWLWSRAVSSDAVSTLLTWADVSRPSRRRDT